MIVFIEDLNNYRERIKGIDYSIMALISQRVNLALQIGKLKNEKNLPVRNYQVEKQVFERIERYSQEFQLNFEFTKKLYKQIISQSVSAQLQDKYDVIKPMLNKKVLILGGSGKMGNWFVRFLSSSGYTTEIVDPQIKASERGHTVVPEDLDIFDYIFVCVPLSKIREVIEMLINRKTTAVIFEIASLKSGIIDLIETAKAQNINLISIHPMFGPDVTDLSDRNLIVCTGLDDNDSILNEVQTIFRETMINIHSLELKKHDEKMLYSLGLSHFINILNGFILSKSEIQFTDMNKIAGSTFNNQIKTTMEVYRENPELYYSIQQINAYQDKLYNEIQQRVNELIDIIKHDDHDKFVKIMEKGKIYLDGGEQI
ncbi:MAG: bifunctional chorismate mutase/prephenate dehydrogenase [Candidatus Heimdallarchaeota archaeon]|nr:bifunctional chorismate mutase/prephenate dehydrogenase [Candidatus Heimdallarchaeota archaeon]